MRLLQSIMLDDYDAMILRLRSSVVKREKRRDLWSWRWWPDTPLVWQGQWDKYITPKWPRWSRTAAQTEIWRPHWGEFNFVEHEWDERSEMFFLNDSTNPPENSLHLKNRSALAVNVDDSLTSCSTSSQSTTSQYAARAVLHEGLQVTLNHFHTYMNMCRFYFLVTPTFDLVFRLEKRNAGKTS